jgi:aryl-alcohol dehydrogenase-like predicted oxidoreductase
MGGIDARPLGRTGLTVPPIGLGTGSLGSAEVGEADAERLLLGAVDLGVRLFDAARSYGLAEERIGRYLGARRRDVVLSTKVGYGIDGLPDWTGQCVAAGVDRALRWLRTDVIDIVHLHSCPRDVLQRGDVIDALVAAVAEGKVRVAAYSGDNEELAWAVGDGRFGSVQASFSVCDQANLRWLTAGRSRGLGTIAKRPLADAPWRFAGEPAAPDLAEYWRRWRTLALPEFGLDRHALMARFAAWTPGVDCCLVGTTSLQRLAADIEAVAQGPLPDEVAARVVQRFSDCGASWRAVI